MTLTALAWPLSLCTPWVALTVCWLCLESHPMRTLVTVHGPQHPGPRREDRNLGYAPSTCTLRAAGVCDMEASPPAVVASRTLPMLVLTLAALWCTPAGNAVAAQVCDTRCRAGPMLLTECPAEAQTAAGQHSDEWLDGGGGGGTGAGQPGLRCALRTQGVPVVREGGP